MSLPRQFALACALAVAPIWVPLEVAGQDAVADSAWRAGDLALAERLYERQLAADPGAERALHRLALMRAWAGRYAESTDLFDRLLALSPANLEAALDRARVIAWAGDLPGSLAMHEELVRRNPDSREARRGLAQVLSWSDRLDDAERLYVELLEEGERDAEALAGFARVAAWSDRLVIAERRWRDALERLPGHPDLLTGLGQTLRWQGRDAAALEHLEAALEAAPQLGDARREAAEARAALAPRAEPRTTYETDSDGNRIATVRVRQTLRPKPRLAIRASGYGRRAENANAGLGATAYGGRLEAEALLEPGWRVSAVAGAGLTSAEDGAALADLGVTLRTPARHPTGVTLALERTPIDETAHLILSRVAWEGARADVRSRLGAWRLEAGGGVGRFIGEVSNRRALAHAGVTRTLRSGFRVGIGVRGFGFRDDVDEGYFDPALYAIGELRLGWTGQAGDWRLGFLAAPGLQRVRRDATTDRAAFRTTAEAVRAIAPGRELHFGALYSTTRLDGFSADDGGYRYVRLSLGLTWAF